MEKKTGECGIEEDGGGGDASCVSIPRGGPIYVTDMLSPITRVSSFESSLLQQLQNLQTELCSDTLETCNEDLSVDELKIVTEDELVNKAFEEAFKDSEVSLNSLLGLEEHYNERRGDDGRISCRDNSGLESCGRGKDASTSEQSFNNSPLRTGDKGNLRKNISKQRKRKGSCIAEKGLLAKMKQKQDEDKAAARLHSLNCRIVQCANTSSEKIERLTSLKSTSYKSKVRPSNTCEHVPVLYPEVVLCVEVYHNKQTWVKTKEFLVLGCQPLTELRDKIYCLTDEIMKKAGQHDPSGYFLIENIFCNDLRDPSAIDYSEPIFTWLRNSEKEAREKWECIISGELRRKQKSLLGSVPMPQFKAVDMHKTRFCDLRFRLGAGYLYCHQGDCKHIIVIRDMRLIHPEDVQNRAAYPLVTFQFKFRAQKCSVCKIYLAQKVTVDDKWAPENPCYFCDVCYYMLHYSNRSLLYNDFSVYDYFHEQ